MKSEIEILEKLFELEVKRGELLDSALAHNNNLQIMISNGQIGDVDDSQYRNTLIELDKVKAQLELLQWTINNTTKS
jgi:hypothetical protein